jgi:type II secretory pathway component PulF
MWRSGSSGLARGAFRIFNKPKAEDVAIFTRGLALLLRAGARINGGLELLCADRDFGRLRPVVADIRSHIIAGERFAEAPSGSAMAQSCLMRCPIPVRCPRWRCGRCARR